MRVVVLAVPLIALLLSPSASGLTFFEPFPNVFVFLNSPSPRQNDMLVIDVFTYLSGRLVDADELPEIGFTQYGLEKPVEGFARVGVGHYRSHLDLSTLSPVFLGPATTGEGFFTVWGNVSGIPYGRQPPLRFHRAGLYVRLTTNATHPFPGDVVEVRAEVYNGSMLIEPDTLSVRVLFPTDPPSVLELPLDRKTLGVYTSNFTHPVIDMDLSLATGLRNPHMKAIARYRGMDFDTRANFQYTRYQVWFHRTPLTGDEFQGAFWVADARGQPGRGVPVSLFQEGGQRLEVVTDSSGRVPGELTFTEVDLPRGGRVGVGTATENFFGTPILRSRYDGGVTPLDPSVMPDGTLRDLLRPNTSITRRYLIENRSLVGPGEPVANMEVSYYVWTRHYVVDAGRLTTDANSEVSLSFAVPPEDVLVGFMQAQDYAGMEYEVLLGSGTYTVASPAAGLNVSALTLGGPTVVRALPAERLADLADQHAPYFHQSSISMLPLSGGERWERWSNAVGDLQTTGSGYERVYHLPAFLPDDAEYLVEASLFTGSDGLSQFAVLSPGEEVEIPVGTDLIRPPAGPPPEPFNWLLVLGPGMAAVAGVILFVVLWRRRKSPPGDYGE